MLCNKTVMDNMNKMSDDSKNAVMGRNSGLQAWDSKEIPRKEGPLRVMVVMAHPDDPDFDAGGLSIKLAMSGARVRFVSLCNGNMGHHQMMPAELAARRKKEAAEAAKVFGVEDYLVLDNGDCSLMPTYENRVEIVKIWGRCKEEAAIRFSDAWKRFYPDRPVPRFMEAYEVSEYGRKPPPGELEKFFV